MANLLDQKTKSTNRIGMLCEMIFSGGTPNTTTPQYWNGSIPWLSSGETRNDYINKTEKTITSEGVENSSTRLAQKNDVVMATAGQGLTRGQTSFLNIDTYINQSLIALRANKAVLDPKYLYYNLKFRYPELRALSDATSSRGSITCPMLSSLEIQLPDLTTQKKIAGILGAYDAKIENNNLIIENLDLMTRVIFDEWFIKFRFPGYKANNFDEIENEKIPSKWAIKNLDEVADILFGFTFKSNLFNENGNGVKVVRIRDVLSGATETFSPEEVEEKFRIQSGDLLIGMDGIFHTSMWFSDDCYLNQRVARIRSEIPTYFILQSIRTKLDFLQRTITGATVGHLSNGDIRGFKILLPNDKSLLKPFRDATEEILKLKRENVVLRGLRDRLLAKFI